MSSKPHSESFAWREVQRLASRLLMLGGVGRPEATAIERIANGMLAQVQRGIHTNPALVVFGNPRKGVRKNPATTGEKFSGNVLAVIYVHDEDGDNYVHGFADARLDLKTLDDGTVQIAGLPDETDVEMLANPDGSVTLRGGHGQRLWKHF